MKMKTKHVIVKCKADFSMPLAAMFGVYVIMHGNSSPGGGFQGGVLMAITLLMFFLAYGWKGRRRPSTTASCTTARASPKSSISRWGWSASLPDSTSLWTLSCPTNGRSRRL